MANEKVELLKNEKSAKKIIDRISMAKPEKLPVLTVAALYSQFVGVCKLEGKDQDYAAKRLKIGSGRLSKYLTIFNAHDSIKNFAKGENTNDMETLYLLSKIAEAQLETALKFISDWGEGKIKGGLRTAVNKITASVFKSKNTQSINQLTLTIKLNISDSLARQLKTGEQEAILNLDCVESSPLKLHFPEAHLSLRVHPTTD